MKGEFIERVFELGIPTYLLMPVETLGRKATCELLKDQGCELFILAGGSNSSRFYKPSEHRDVNVGTCCWYGLNTRKGKESLHELFFL